MVLTPKDVHSFLGYSFHFGQYWQYRAASDSGTTWTTAFPIARASLGRYKPLGLVTSKLCEERSDGESGGDEGQDDSKKGQQAQAWDRVVECTHCSLRSARTRLWLSIAPARARASH